MDTGDPSDPDKITSANFASVIVTMIPNPPPADAGPAKPPGKSGPKDAGDEGEDGSVKTKSTKTERSTEAGGTAGTAKTGKTAGSKAGSKRSGSKMGAGDAEEAAKAPEVPLEPPIERALSQLYTNKECSWGFEKLFDLGKMYNYRTGYITGYGEDPKKKHYPVDNLQDGSMTMTIEILAASGIRLDPPRPEGELTPQGRGRVYWTVHNLKRLVEKIGKDKRLSSVEFTSGDDAWYLDLYPNGFKTNSEGAISFYLHISRRSVDLAHVVKRRFKLGIKKTPLKDDDNEKKPKKKVGDTCYFPKGSACMATFTPDARCFGKKEFIKLEDILGMQAELMLGPYENKGGITFVLDYLVDSTETWSVQHMLHEIPVFGHVHDVCAESGKELQGAKVICYHCGKAFCKEETNYQARMEEYGYEIGKDYITDILMRDEEHWLDKQLKIFDPADKIDQFLKWVTFEASKWRLGSPGGAKQDDDEEDEGPLSSTAPSDEKERKLWEMKKKKRDKEIQKQRHFERKIRELRLEVEDAHFSKPICAKCAEKRKKLQFCKVIFANGPEKQTFFLPPPQNMIPPENRNLKITPQWKMPTTVAKEPGAKKAEKPALEPARISTNFRLGWRAVQERLDTKYESMAKAMSTVKIDSMNLEVCHANDEWIKKLMPNDKTNPTAKLGRNAMTIVRGGRYVEPLELTRQCPGRVSATGITPEEDEDEPRSAFCDVRFDIRNPPEQVHCLYSGKVFCRNCAKPEYKVPLPHLEAKPDKAEPVQVCYEAKDALGKMPAWRIQPVSQKPEEEPKRKPASAPEEEEEDPPDYLEILLAKLKKIPLCGRDIAEGIEKLIPED